MFLSEPKIINNFLFRLSEPSFEAEIEPSIAGTRLCLFSAPTQVARPWADGKDPCLRGLGVFGIPSEQDTSMYQQFWECLQWCHVGA